MNLQELISEVLDQLRGMWRYRWWGIAVAWLISIGGWFYVYSLPNIYGASARVYVDTDTLLRPLMQGLTTAQNTMNDVQLLSRAVLTRPNLEKVAYATDLDLRAKTPESMEALITRLQDTITVIGGRDNIYTIAYRDPNRDKARDVVAAVLDNFVEGALGNRGDDVEMSEQALARELEIAEQRLRDAEDRRARFKQENIGYMPGETGDYYNRLQSALGRLAETERALQQQANRRNELRRQIVGEDPVIGIMPTQSMAGCSHGSAISQLEAQLESLRIQYTAIHPRRSTLEETIAELRDECATERQATAGSGPVQPSSSLDSNPVYQNLRIQLSDSEVMIASLNGQLAAQREEVEQLQRDVGKITQVETDLRQLDRDYGIVQARHQEFLRRWEDLQTKRRLDPVSEGVQFRRIDPPFAAADPVGPNRPVMLGMTLVLALGAGAGLAFLLSQLFPVFFTKEKLKRIVEFPVIGSITMILPPDVVARRRTEALTWGGALTVLLLCTAAAVAMAPWGAPLVRRLMEGTAI